MTRIRIATVALGLALGLTAAVPAMAASWTVAGRNGGSAEGSRDCTRAGGTATCSREAQATGPEGRSIARQRQRVTTAEGSTITGGVETGSGRSRGFTLVTRH